MSEQQMSNILAGLLDTFEHPVWIRSVDGDVIANNMAERLDASLNIEDFPHSTSRLLIGGRSYRLRTKNLNHGTEVTMYELTPVDECAERIRACARRVDEAMRTLAI